MHSVFEFQSKNQDHLGGIAYFTIIVMAVQCPSQSGNGNDIIAMVGTIIVKLQ